MFSHKMSVHPPDNDSGSYQKFFVSVAVVSLISACAAVGWLWVAAGSFQGMVEYGSGETLLMRKGEVVLLDDGEFVDLHYKIRNSTDRSISLLGATTTCSCLATSEMPLTIAAFSDADFVVNLGLAPSQEKFEESVTFYTDLPSQPIVKFDVVYARPN